MRTGEDVADFERLMADAIDGREDVEEEEDGGHGAGDQVQLNEAVLAHMESLRISKDEVVQVGYKVSIQCKKTLGDDKTEYFNPYIPTQTTEED